MNLFIYIFFSCLMYSPTPVLNSAYLSFLLESIVLDLYRALVISSSKEVYIEQGCCTCNGKWEGDVLTNKYEKFKHIFSFKQKLHQQVKKYFVWENKI